MSKEKLAPKVRFEEFSAIWKYHGLLDSVTKVIDFRGRTPKKLGLDWSRNGFLALSALNVKNGYIDKDADAHYGDIKLYNKWMLGNELHKGQVLFTTEAPMGNVAQVPDNNKYILSQRTIAFEVKENWITEDYLAVVLRTPSIFRELTTLSSGGTAKGVSQRTLSELDIPIPKDIREQHKIGEFFKKIDKMIQLQHSKVNKVKDIKSAYLSEMFPKEGKNYPKRRFEGFTESWKKVRLGEVFNQSGSGGTPKTTRQEYYGGDIPFLSISDITNSNGYIFNTEKTITIKGLNNSAAWIVPKESISLAMYASVGKVAILKIKSATSQAFYNVVIKNKATRDYVYQYLVKMEVEKMWYRIISTGTQSNLNAEKVRNLIIPMPIDIDEQEKIGQFFKNLDNQISMEEEKLVKLEKLKQAYLNDMFV